MNFLKTISYNLFFFFISIILIELFFGYWFKKENFGIYMRKERKINWQTTSIFNGKKYNFFYKEIIGGLEVKNLIQKMLRLFLKVVVLVIKDILQRN